MGCVHTHQGIRTIKRWGSPSHVQNAMEKIGENNWKAKKTNRVVNETLALGPEHDKIRTQCASDILSKNMLKKMYDGVDAPR